MPTEKQRPHPSGRVVSVRLDRQTIERLDELSARTGRSRGVYLRECIKAMLPRLEEVSWSQVMPRVAAVNDDEFHSIIENLLSEAGYRYRETEDGPA